MKSFFWRSSIICLKHQSNLATTKVFSQQKKKKKVNTRFDAATCVCRPVFSFVDPPSTFETIWRNFYNRLEGYTYLPRRRHVPRGHTVGDPCSRKICRVLVSLQVWPNLKWERRLGDEEPADKMTERNGSG